MNTKEIEEREQITVMSLKMNNLDYKIILILIKTKKIFGQNGRHWHLLNNKKREMNA